MSKCIEKISHPDCGSGDGLQIFQDDNGTYNGFCFACGTFVADPYHDKPKDYKPAALAKSDDEIDRELAEINSYQTVDLPSRSLRAETLEYFDIKVAVSEQDGKTPVAAYFPFEKNGQVHAYKARLLGEKRMWSVGRFKGTEMFGWRQAIAAAAKRLYITEGEYDAAALHQALKDKSKGTQWESYNPSVVSLTSGASSAKKCIVDNMTAIKQNFNEVVLVFDNDAPGQQAVKDVMQVLPTARSVTVPGKDANDCVQQGKSIALCNAVLFKSSVPKNTRLVWGQTLVELGREQAQWGLSWPWEQMTDLTRGLRFGETYYIGAGVKMGKSEVVNAIAKHLIIDHDMKVFLAKPEESNRKSFQMVAGKVAGRIFHDPKVEFDFDAYDAAAEAIGDKLCFLNLYQHLGWETLKNDIIAAVSLGCRAVFIDPITNLTNGVASGEANTVLQAIAQDLAAMAKDLEIIIFIFCHLKAPASGDSHERGGAVLSHQFSGSRAMMRSCNYMIGIEGNKNPDHTIEERNIRSLVLLEDREFGNVGRMKLYWDHKTGLFNEIVNETGEMKITGATNAT